MKVLCKFCEGDSFVSLGRNADKCMSCGAILKGLDDYVEEEAIKRKNDPYTITLDEAMEKLGFDESDFEEIDRILKDGEKY